METEWEPGMQQLKGLILGGEADLLNLQMECLRDMACRMVEQEWDNVCDGKQKYTHAAKMTDLLQTQVSLIEG